MPIIENEKNFDFSTFKSLIESLFGYIASQKEAAPKEGKTQKKKILSGIVLKRIKTLEFSWEQITITIWVPNKI
jgi:hypothetical protein